MNVIPDHRRLLLHMGFVCYTCYAEIQAYNTFTSYYSKNLNVLNLVMYVITTCYQSLCFSVLFYALGVFSEGLKNSEEAKVIEEKQMAEEKTEVAEEKEEIKKEEEK
mgnify:CR=1 FL=1